MKPQLQATPIGMVILILLLLSSTSLKVKADVPQSVAPIGLPGCQTSCGNVSIPFPFGIGANCFLDPWYEIQCKPYPHPNSSARPFLPKLEVEVLEIVLDDMWVNAEQYWDSYRFHIQTLTVSIPPLKVCTVDTQPIRLSSIDLRGGPYNFSTDDHVFLLEGCAGSAVLVDQTEATMAGCSTICHNNNTAISRNKCYRVECCQMQLPSTNPPQDAAYSPLQFFHIDFYGQSSGERPNCLAATLMSNHSLNEYMGNSLTSNPSPVPMVLLWSWVSSRFPDYNPDQAWCGRDEGTNITTTSCECNHNSYGNPYVFNGCQVPDGCKQCDQCVQRGKSYFCQASGEATFVSPSVISSIYERVGRSIVVSIGGTLLLVFLVFGCCRIPHFIKRRSKTARRIKVFKLRLQQHQSTNEGVVERTKLFSHKHLDKATNHFNENRVLGKGGQGIVYKGMLDDGRTVAVKQLKMMDESEMDQFINEVVILSQINHRNVVKLLGCCLEKEVPLLVYEFITNGTLSQHIHDPNEDFILSWSMRLKIAADTAGAIAYLHSYSSIPIYHRDIKSSNILLDEKYKAKVSDFGSSKATSIDQTHLTTLVRGTWGYLDPEYFQSNQFTDKSDVYSFGVVLLELLTSKKPIYRNIESMEQKSLATEFLLIGQNSQLFDILDPQVVNEAKEEELVVVANLAKRCLNDSGRMRPTMREVAMTLDMIIKSPTEMPTQDQPNFPDEESDENAMVEMSDVGFMSSPLPSGVANSLYIDVHPLLHDTI